MYTIKKTLKLLLSCIQKSSLKYWNSSDTSFRNET